MQSKNRKFSYLQHVENTWSQQIQNEKKTKIFDAMGDSIDQPPARFKKDVIHANKNTWLQQRYIISHSIIHNCVNVTERLKTGSAYAYSMSNTTLFKLN